MKASTLWIGAIVIIAVVAGYMLFKPSTNYDVFAQCVTDAGAMMYGAWWCPHCADQKKAFGGSFTYIDYIECSESDGRTQTAACASANIRSYPTWEFGDGRRLEGVLTFEDLSRLTNCPLPA